MISNINLFDLAVEPEWCSIKVIYRYLCHVNFGNYLTFLIAGGTQRPSNACGFGA